MLASDRWGPNLLHSSCWDVENGQAVHVLLSFAIKRTGKRIKLRPQFGIVLEMLAASLA